MASEDLLPDRQPGGTPPPSPGELETLHQRIAQLEGELTHLRQQTNEQRLRDINRLVPGAIYQYQVNLATGGFEFTYISDRVREIFELEPAAVYQNPQLMWDRIHPQDLAQVAASSQQATEQRSAWQAEFRILTPGGQEKWLRGQSHPVPTPPGYSSHSGIFIDITAAKQTEAALKASQARLTLALQRTDSGLWDWNIAIHRATVSPEFERLLGYAPGEFGDGFAGWQRSLHPEDAEAAHAALEAHLKDESVPYILEERLQTKTGEWRWFEVAGSVVEHDELGHPQRMIGTIRDISDRKAAELELRRSSEQLQQRTQELESTLAELQHTQLHMIQSEKMSSLGQMVAGVAHEINNPVNFIHGNLGYVEQYTQQLLRLVDLYQTTYPQPAEAIQSLIEEMELQFLQADLSKLLASMRLGTERIGKIVKSLRNFSRLDEAEIKNVNLHDGLDSTIVILQHRLRSALDHKEIHIQRHYQDLPLVECWAGQLNQVFLNLISNAIDALETGEQGDPAIAVYTERTEDPHWVRIRIVDNGPGMEEAVRSRIFDPFFTTKPVGQGTGLGLSISYQIVTEKHGGRLICHSTPGKGSEFVIELPIAPSP